MAGPEARAIAETVTSASGDVGARERILSTAYELFSVHGLNVIGVDRIVAESGVAKTTLYRHFRSREGLVLAVLELHEALWTRAWLQQEIERRARTPRTRLLAIFDAFGDWFDEASFEGCLFTNVLLETHDDSSAIRISAVKRLATIRDLVQTYADGAGIPEPEALLRQPGANLDVWLDRRRRRRPPGSGRHKPASSQGCSSSKRCARHRGARLVRLSSFDLRDFRAFADPRCPRPPLDGHRICVLRDGKPLRKATGCPSCRRSPTTGPGGAEPGSSTYASSVSTSKPRARDQPKCAGETRPHRLWRNSLHACQWQTPALSSLPPLAPGRGHKTDTSETTRATSRDTSSTPRSAPISRRNCAANHRACTR